MAQQQQDDDIEDEELGVTETYADYMPSKLNLGAKHSDPVVETSSLSSVFPPDVTYQLSIPPEVISGRKLSALQLEAITYACQQHEKMLCDGTRAGYFIGDGAGVGKGRTIAGIIYENYLRGRKKALWISVSSDLRYDCERDLTDIEAGHIKIYSLNKLKYAKINSSVNGDIRKGVVYSTYSSLIGESSSVSGKYSTRLKQLVQWCGDDFDGLIIFDECHRAKNLCASGSSKPTKTGVIVLELQRRLPSARIVYASATGACEPRHMAYMARLGIWGERTSFAHFNDFVSAVERRGVGAMEVVAMDMKLRGCYIARQLSFHGTSFSIDNVPLEKSFIGLYNDSVALWVDARQKFQQAVEIMEVDKALRKSMWAQFWSSHQRFFKYLCIGAKLRHVVHVASEAVKTGKCVVIGLQSTGEARTLEQLERDDGELSEFVSTARGVIQSLIEKHFPAPDKSRVNRVLGAFNLKSTGTANRASASDIQPAAAVASCSTRKSARQAARRQVSRKRGLHANSSSSSSSDDDSSVDEITSSTRNGRRPFGKSQKRRRKNQQADKDFELSGTSESDEKTATEEDEDLYMSSSELSDSISGSPVKAVKSARNGAAGRALNSQSHVQSAAARGMKQNCEQAINRCCALRQQLLDRLERLGPRLPVNALDELIDQLGGPENVAEMTGRKGRVVQQDSGHVQYESRAEADVPLEVLNMAEKRRFMSGEKQVAVISEAASSGISLQADRRVANQRRRVHITLELPWSADKAIQQFGRTHRSNQVSAPEYVFMISELAGERRFASIVAKRLESLGALTHGDRRASESRDLSRYNIDTKYGRNALETVMKTVMGYEQPLVSVPTSYRGNFLSDVKRALVGVGLIIHENDVFTLDKDFSSISKFLNRLLGMPVDLQNGLFEYFTDTLDAIVKQAKRTGRYDMGILDMGGGADDAVRCVSRHTFTHKHATGCGQVQVHVISQERGLSWSEALNRLHTTANDSSHDVKDEEGFYLSKMVRSGKRMAILVLSVADSSPPHTHSAYRSRADVGSQSSKKQTLFTVYRPNTGLQTRLETIDDIRAKYKRVDSGQYEQCDTTKGSAPSDSVCSVWTNQYEQAASQCSHMYWRGSCRHSLASSGASGDMNAACQVGRRLRHHHVMSGSVLQIWSRVESTLVAHSTSSASSWHKMQVVRVKCDDTAKIVGILLPNQGVKALIEMLISISDSHQLEQFDEQPKIKAES